MVPNVRLIMFPIYRVGSQLEILPVIDIDSERTTNKKVGSSA
jgi:hypothetical protein